MNIELMPGLFIPVTKIEIDKLANNYISLVCSNNEPYNLHLKTKLIQCKYNNVELCNIKVITIREIKDENKLKIFGEEIIL